MNFLTKGILTATILISPSVIINNQQVSANSSPAFSDHQVKQTSSDLDVSQGWTNIKYFSDIAPDVDKIFLQDQDITGNQKGALVQAGNLGNSSFTAQKVIPMKKGHKYDLDLIFAQFYNQQGDGFIDFNGEKITATTDPTEQNYKKTLTPTEDMNYTITVSFTTVYPGNAYFKIAYDKSNGGITDTLTTFEAPDVTPVPEAGTNKVSGTAYKGNTVVVSDTEGEIGIATVSDDGTFDITTNRALKYKETLKVIQKNDTEISPVTTVEVDDTIPPEVPILNKMTDEDEKITGTSEPYSTVEVTFNDSSLPIPQKYSGTVNSEGNFTIPLEHTYKGKTKIAIKAIDEAGHESTEGAGEVEFANKLELTLGHRISSVDTMISGVTSRPNCELTLHFGSRIYKGKSDDKGDFKITIDKYTPATEYIVEAVDPRELDQPFTMKDKVLPRIPNMSSVKSGVKVLEGVVDPGAEVFLKLTRDENTFDYKVTADNKGQFTISLKDNEGNDLALQIGDQLIYSAKLTVDGDNLISEEGTSSIFTF